MQQSISFVVTTKIGPFVSIIQHITFEKFIWCLSKYHEMKILLPVTSAKIWPESGMLTVNITTGVIITRFKTLVLSGLSSLTDDQKVSEQSIYCFHKLSQMVQMPQK